MSLQPQTMLLDEGHERLYVGANNTLFSLSLDQVNTHHRQVGLLSSTAACWEVLNSYTHNTLDNLVAHVLNIVYSTMYSHYNFE